MATTTQTKRGIFKNTDPMDLVTILQAEGYDFRLNVLDDSLEVDPQGAGWVRCSDPLWFEINTKLRSLDLRGRIKEAGEAIWTFARAHPHHPVLDYLQSLQYDGGAHITHLASKFTDKHGMFPVFQRKWLIGAVARAYTGVQLPMLTLEGLQGIGKSDYVRWLAPGREFYVDEPIEPDSKDCRIRACSRWIWEVSELGSTTSRADQEALKSFLTTETFVFRKPYGMFDIVKPALACFIGTVNLSAGFLNDSTGSRRFWATTIEGINWDYRTTVDRDQVWAEAHAAYLAGEDWRLNDGEATESAKINEDYMPDDPIENALIRSFKIDPANGLWWTASLDILQELRGQGLANNPGLTAKSVSMILRKLGCKPDKRSGERGWLGVWK